MTHSDRDLRAEFDALSAKVDALSTEVKELSEESLGLSDRLDDKVGDLSSIVNKNAYDFNLRLIALEAKVNSQEFHVEQSKLDAAVAENTEHIKVEANLIAENEALRTKCHDLGIEVTKLTDQLEATRAEYVELTDDRNKYLNQFEADRAEYTKLRIQFEELQEEKARWGRMLNHAEAECEQLRAENETLGTRLRRAEADFAAIQEICSDG